MILEVLPYVASFLAGVLCYAEYHRYRRNRDRRPGYIHPYAIDRKDD